MHKMIKQLLYVILLKIRYSEGKGNRIWEKKEKKLNRRIENTFRISLNIGIFLMYLEENNS